MTTAAEITRAAKKLPARQRLKLAEEIWLSGVEDKLPVSAAQRQLLDQRWTDYRAGKISRISRSELDRRLAAK